MPATYRELRQITARLERHYKDVQDFEFTIEDGKLFMLQTRNGKRTGYAAVVVATDMVAEKLMTPKQAVLRSIPRRSRSCWRRFSIPKPGPRFRSRPRASRRHRVPRPARSSSRPTMRWSGRGRARR